jgi:hypothetical protein
MNHFVISETVLYRGIGIHAMCNTTHSLTCKSGKNVTENPQLPMTSVDRARTIIHVRQIRRCVVETEKTINPFEIVTDSNECSKRNWKSG